MIIFSSCVPTSDQVPDSVQFTDKKLDRKIASENAKNTFNALSVQMNIRIGDREYIQNVFIDVFGTGADALVRPFIINQGPSLNGGCSQYEATYADNLVVNAALPIDDVKVDCNLSVLNLSVIGSENVIREGQRLQACEVVVNNSTALFYLIDKVTGITNVQASFATNPTVDHIKKIYSNFYPAQSIPSDVLTGLLDLGASTSLTTAKDRFKLIALTICMSADWQIP